MQNKETEKDDQGSQGTQQIQLPPKRRLNIIREFVFDGKMTYYQKEQNNNTKVFMYFALLGLSVFSSVLVQQLISQESSSSTISVGLKEFYDGNFLYRIAFVALIVLKILLLLSVVMEIIVKKQVLVVSWINKICVNNYTILKQLDLSISGILVLVSWRENLGQLIVAGVISLFYAVYLQEYTNRREHLYVSSSTQYILFRSFLLINYFANCFFLILNKQIYLACYSAFAFTLLLTWYLIYGHELYFHNFSKIGFLAVVSLLLTIYLTIIQSYALNTSYVNLKQIAKLMLIFSVLTCFIVLMLKASLATKMSALSLGLRQVGSKSANLMLHQLLNESASDKESQSMLIGILNYSYDVKQDILINYIDEKIYDSYLKESVAREGIYLQKESAFRFYIKGLYEKSLEKEKDAEILLEYCQFIVNQIDNIYYALKLVKRARLLSLNIVQLVKVAKMEIFLKQHHNKLNQQLYNGNLEIQHILEAEDCFSHIELKIYQYIFGSLDVWSSLRLQEIEMAELRKALKREMKTIQEINSLWKTISKFFKINKAWRFIYVHYTMFIQNEKIKQKELDFFTTPNNQSISDQQALYFEESTPQGNLYDSNIMFNQNSCCLFAAYEDGDLYIKDVNSRFTKMLGYSSEEINGSPLSIIMHPQIVADHSKKFKEWVSSGYLTNESYYHPRFTTLMTKEASQIPTVKYYKTFYHIERGLEFVCLLQSNQKPIINDSGANNRIQSFGFCRQDKNSTDFIRKEHIQLQFEGINQDKGRLEKNIFVKEDPLQPQKTISDIKYFKIAARLFSMLMVVAILVLADINNIQSQTLNNYSNQFITFMNIYRFPILLNTNYMKQFLKIGNITKVNAMIASATTQFLQSSNKLTTQSTIFDENLNAPSTYYPYYNYSLPNKENLSHIDLFYSIVSAVSTLSTNAVNRTSQQYQLFNTYIKPSYDNMMNKTKYQLHSTFGRIFSQAINQQMWFIIGQSMVLILFILVLFKLIHGFIKKMKNIILILLDFHPTHVLQTYRYWKTVNKSFRKLFLQVNEHNSSPRQLSSVNQSKLIDRQSRMTQMRTSLNKQVKMMKEDVQRKRFEIKLRVLLVLIMLSILVVTVSIQFSLMTNLQKLRTFENDGFFFLRYFPVGPIVAMGCIEKYYSDQFPKEISFNPTKYEGALSTMFIFGHSNNYIGQIADPTSLYYTKQKNYFFGSPCEFNPSIVINAGTTVEKCLSICNGTFKQGISSYLRYGQRLGDRCINNKTLLTTAQMDEFTLAGTVLSAYVLDAIVTWASEFSQKVADLQAQNLSNSMVIIFVIIAIHFLVMENWLIGFIKSEYQFVKQIYLHFVPEFILVNEKVIRQKFVIEGIVTN